MSSIPTHMQACQIQSQGGLEVISVSSIPVPVLAKNQVLVKVEYAGVNFIDTCESALHSSREERRGADG
jgi:NADPH2:quinone reductase